MSSACHVKMQENEGKWAEHERKWALRSGSRHQAKKITILKRFSMKLLKGISNTPTFQKLQMNSQKRKWKQHDRKMRRNWQANPLHLYSKRAAAAQSRFGTPWLGTSSPHFPSKPTNYIFMGLVKIQVPPASPQSLEASINGGKWKEMNRKWKEINGKQKKIKRNEGMKMEMGKVVKRATLIVT